MALAIKNNYSTSKHHQLMGWFNRTFVKTGKVKTEIGRIYLTALEKRTKGDYEDMKVFTLEEDEVDFKEMIRFVQVVERLINEK